MTNGRPLSNIARTRLVLSLIGIGSMFDALASLERLR